MNAARFPSWLTEAVGRTSARCPLFWRFQLAGWAAFLVITLPAKLSLSGDWVALLGSFAVRDGFCFALTLGMRVLYQRIYEIPARPVWITLVILATSVVGGVLQVSLFLVLGRVLPFEEQTIFGTSAAFGIFYYRTGLFLGWGLLYFGIRQMLDGMDRDLRLSRTESEKREAELQMLRAQMNPHFLFNALTTIETGISRTDSSLKEVVQALADYLRYSLQHRSDDLVPLGDEFDAVAAYLAVEQARFREELEIHVHIDESARATRVPGILLQPLVENAIKYGRKTSPTPLRVRLDVRSLPGDLIRIEVVNSGHWIEPSSGRQIGGVGLENLRRRLNLLYPGQHDLKTLTIDDYVSVKLELRTPA